MRHILTVAGRNKTLAARLLGNNRALLYRKIKKLVLSPGIPGGV